MTTPNSYRLIVVGDSGVGKSSIVSRLVENIFLSEHCTTLGVDFRYCHFGPEETGLDQKVTLNVWDTAGQETFLSITQQFIRGADAAFLCFDVTDSKSYENVKRWKERVAGEKNGAITMVLVGCKCDLDGMRTVSKSEAAAFAAENDLPYFETSSKENQNVRPTFLFISKKLYEQRAASGAGGGSGGATRTSGGTSNDASRQGVKLQRVSPGAGAADGGGAGAAAGNGGGAAAGSTSGKCRC